MYDGDILTIDATPRNTDLFASVLRMYGFDNEVVVTMRLDSSPGLPFRYGPLHRSGRPRNASFGLLRRGGRSDAHEYSGPESMSEDPVPAKKMVTWQMRRPFLSTKRPAQWGPAAVFMRGVFGEQ